MRYLWKDWPQPVKTGATKNPMLNDILLPNEGWQLVGEGYRFSEGPAVNAKGEVFFDDGPAGNIWKVSLDGKVNLFAENSGNVYGQAFAPNGDMYAAAMVAKKILTYKSDGKSKMITEGFAGNDLVVANNGNAYVTNPSSDANLLSKVWLIRPNGEKVEVDNGLKFANGVTLSPDQTLLYVADTRSHWVYSYSILPDGTLTNKNTTGFMLRIRPMMQVQMGSKPTAMDGCTLLRVWASRYVTRPGVSMPLFLPPTENNPISASGVKILTFFMPLAAIKCINEK
jgi:sugar lactone lactonase YvrE